MSSLVSRMDDERRLRGVYYTPPLLADWMVRETLRRCFVRKNFEPTILDPACGAGVFLLSAREQLAKSGVGDPWRLLHGVDLDEGAIRSLRGHLSDHGPKADSKIISTQILHADALTESGTIKEPDEVCGIDWGSAFQDVFRRGGFDVIIANPPYLREKDAREEFARIARSEWGRRHKEARMDLWHYFLHRALDVVRPGGIVCFLVNSYWTQATGAGKLIDRLEGETTLLDVVDFGTTPLFEGVQGRHMVLWLQAGRTEQACRIRRIAEGSRLELLELLKIFDVPDRQTVSEISLAQSELYTGGRMMLEKRLDPPAGSARLGECYEIRQGIAENPPVVTRRHADLFPGRWNIGEGVFVLTDTEVEKLGLSPAEAALLRPYYETRELDRYFHPARATRSILYLTPRTAPEIELLPHIKKHLERFRELLEPRREVQRKVIRWWHLHWPREERLFREPRIISLQMGGRPRFLLCRTPTAVGFSCHVLLPKSERSWTPSALTAILNSKWGEGWFERTAKRRGKKYDIGGSVLKDFPVPPYKPEMDERLSQLAEERQRLSCVRSEQTDSEGEEIEVVEGEINRLIDRLYSTRSLGAGEN